MSQRADQTPRTPRKSGPDAFRLLSVLAVLGTHAAVYEGSVQWVASILSKWSVPYFFLVLGYFLGRKTDACRTSPAIERSILMFLVACIVMLPLGLVRDGPTAVWEYMVQNVYYSGTYFHLWYLNSLFMGLLVLRLMDVPSRRRFMPSLAITMLIASVVLSSYLNEDIRYLGRHLMSIPFLWIGTRLTRRVPSMSMSVALVLLGLAIESLERWVLHTYLGREMWHCPITLGTIAYAVGMFGISFNLPPSRPLQRLGELGARYSGCIYVTHLYALACIGLLGSLLHVRQTLIFRLLVIPAAMLLNLLGLRLLDRLSPRFIDGLLGQRAALLQAWRAMLRLPASAVRSVRALPSRS